MAEEGHETKKERYLPDDMSSLTPSEVTAEGKLDCIWISANILKAFYFLNKQMSKLKKSLRKK